MRFIESKFFMTQLSVLSSKYPMIYDDYEDLKLVFNPSFSVGLGDNCYRQRFKNSSIPTGTRGGFGFIIKVFGDYHLDKHFVINIVELIYYIIHIND